MARRLGRSVLCTINPLPVRSLCWTYVSGQRGLLRLLELHAWPHGERGKTVSSAEPVVGRQYRGSSGLQRAPRQRIFMGRGDVGSLGW